MHWILDRFGTSTASDKTDMEQGGGVAEKSQDKMQDLHGQIDGVIEKLKENLNGLMHREENQRVASLTGQRKWRLNVHRRCLRRWLAPTGGRTSSLIVVIVVVVLIIVLIIILLATRVIPVSAPIVTPTKAP